MVMQSTSLKSTGQRVKNHRDAQSTLQAGGRPTTQNISVLLQMSYALSINSKVTPSSLFNVMNYGIMHAMKSQVIHVDQICNVLNFLWGEIPRNYFHYSHFTTLL